MFVSIATHAVMNTEGEIMGCAIPTSQSKNLNSLLAITKTFLQAASYLWQMTWDI